MSLKDLKEAAEKDKVTFGLKQALKNSKSKKKIKVYVVSDVRQEVFKKLEEKGIDFERIKSRQDVQKELGLDFECEVFSIN